MTGNTDNRETIAPEGWAEGIHLYEDHPRYEDQVNFELAMRDGLIQGEVMGGHQKAVHDAAKADASEAMVNLKPYRSTIEAWLPDVALGVRQFVNLWSREARHGALRPISVTHLATVDPYLSAFIAIRTLLNAMTFTSKGMTGLAYAAKAIGTALEHEAQMEAWEKQEPKLYHGVRRNLNRNHADQVHTRRVNINRFNSLMAQGVLKWEAWSEAEKYRIGIDLLNIVIQRTQQFFLGQNEETVQHAKRKASKPQRVIKMRPETYLELASRIEKQGYYSPVYLPTIIPPKRWKGTRDGGYFTPFVNAKLITPRLNNEISTKGIEEEYYAADMPVPYEALHTTQETPWAVDHRVLAAASHIWEYDLATAGIPRRALEEIALIPVAYTGQKLKAWRQTKTGRAWREKAARAHSRNAMKAVHILTIRRVMTIADRLRDEPKFYFPHKIDFRGRIYPIPVDLQPQGGDLARGLLMFAEGKPLGDKGLAWLAINIATAFGMDKISFDERLSWVTADKQSKRWERIASDPIGSLKDWAHEKKPFQCLSAVLEYRAALDWGMEHGDAQAQGFVTHVPVRVDGTCNGLQHLSAMVRDEVGGKLVNLMPSDEPQDIYAHVAKGNLQEELTRLSERGSPVAPREGGISDKAAATWWLNLTTGAIPRSLTKGPVMVLPYGGSRTAFADKITEWLQTEHPELWNRDDSDWRLLGQMAFWLSGPMEEAVKPSVGKAIEVMKYLKACGRVAAKGDQPIYWRTPAGFVVRHFYGKIKIQQIHTKIDGQKFRVNLHTITDKLDLDKQLAGIPPNFTHSIDASCLMTTIVMLKARGVKHVTSIHDAYGTLATDMWIMFEVIREAFVWTHQTDVLKTFRNACLRLVTGNLKVTQAIEDEFEAMQMAEEALPKPPEYGELDLEQVLGSDYFFA